MKIICAGLSKTGTSSLGAALEELGFSCLHFDQQRLNDIIEGRDPNPDFRRYDDIDAVLDVPSAFFFRELLAAYPSAKVILTVRDVDEWWISIRDHFKRLPIVWPTWKDRVRYMTRGAEEMGSWLENSRFRTNVRTMVYGSPDAREFMYKKRYREHNAAVMNEVPAERLLTMDIAAGDGWNTLCPFLGLPRPEVAFPHQNKGKDQPVAPLAAQQGVRAIIEQGN
jgi:hypothetical protein